MDPGLDFLINVGALEPNSFWGLSQCVDFVKCVDAVINTSGFNYQVAEYLKTVSSIRGAFTKITNCKNHQLWGIGYLAQRCNLGCLPHGRACAGSRSSFLLRRALGGRRWWLKHCHPNWDLNWASNLCLAYPRLLEAFGEWISDAKIAFSLFLFTFQIG